MAVDDSKLPLVLPSSVARTQADGRPTKALIDWEFETREWYKQSAVDLDYRVTTTSSQTDQNSAEINEERTARTDSDNALASQITTVSATANAATANGQIYFAAAAAPGGSTAAYGLYLTAGSAFTGLELLAMSNGTSAIALNAGQFTFTDSGTATQVFNYAAGRFTFNVPVTVQNQDIGQNAVTNSSTASNPGTATAYLTVRAGAQVIIQAAVSNPSASQRLGGLSEGITSRPFPVLVDGIEIGRIVSVDGIISHQASGGGNPTLYYYATMPAAQSFLATGLGAGQHTFQLYEPTGNGLTCSITVTELSK